MVVDGDDDWEKPWWWWWLEFLVDLAAFEMEVGASSGKSLIRRLVNLARSLA